jgi:hypothetical protein
MMARLHDVLLKRGVLFIAIGVGMLGLAAVPAAPKPKQEPTAPQARPLLARDWMDIVATVSDEVSPGALLGDEAPPPVLVNEFRKRKSDSVAFERICAKVRSEAQLLLMMDAAAAMSDMPSEIDRHSLSDLLPEVRDDQMDVDSYDAARIALELLEQAKADSIR